MSINQIILKITLICLCLGACGSPPKVMPNPPALASQTSRQTPLSTVTHPPTRIPTQTASPLPSATLTPEATTTPSPTLNPSPTATPSPIPTYVILRGVVIPAKVSCRYGPGWMYLYLYGMVSGATQDVIGRTEPMLEQRSDRTWEQTTWLLTRSHGDTISCWVKANFIDLQGDLASLEVLYPDKYTIPHSNQRYRYPWNVIATRKNNQVTISWQSDPRRAGDEESATSVLYLVETWICQNGQFYFSPVGAYSPQITVIDEPGCSQPSHGRVYFSEKHGYTGPTEITWPPAK